MQKINQLLVIIALAIAPVAFGMEEEVVAPAAPAQALLSVQDLIDRGELPAIDENGRLDLSEKGLVSLQGLENIPNPEQITSLDLGGNKIIDIPEHAFDPFVNLTYLRLIKNPIIEIRPKTFDKLVNLEGLCLEDTFIVDLPPHLFDAVRKMKTLHLFDNKLESLPKGIFDNLTNLEALALENNKLSSLDPDLLKHQTKIESLTIENNPLTQLPHITHLTNLKEIRLAGTSITELSPEVVGFIRARKIGLDKSELLGEIPPYSLNQLIADLGDNWTAELYVFDPVSGQTTFNLDNRGLTDLSMFDAYMPGVQAVSARFNYIQAIPDNFFAFTDLATGQLMPRFPNLEVLNLSNNMIKELSLISKIPWGTIILPLQFAKCCPHLMTIDLSNNRITHVQKGLFNGLHDLYELELDRNLIRSIEDGAFNDLGELEELDLAHNKLQVLPKNIFKNLHSAENIYLYHNSLGNREQYAFPPKAEVDFYPQKTPSLKMLVAKKVAESFERKNLIEVYKTLQTIPQEIHEDILAAASKNAALKIRKANKMQRIFRLIARDTISKHKELIQLHSKDLQEAMLAVAPEELRPQLIELGLGGAIPSLSTKPRAGEPAVGEEPDEEFELMEE